MGRRLTRAEKHAVMRAAAANLRVQPARPGSRSRRGPQRARNEQIALAYADLGQRWTVRELADLYGITPQRVGQIVAEYCPHATRRRRGSRSA